MVGEYSSFDAVPTLFRATEGHFIVVDFYNQINLLYGSITEFCSPQSCPEMKATDECAQAIVSM